MRFQLALAAALALATVSPASADSRPSRTVDRQIDVGSARALVLASSAGDVHIGVSTDSAVHVHAKLSARSSAELDRMDVNLSADGDAVHLSSVLPSHSAFNWSASNEDIDYDVTVPRGLSVAITLTAGDVVVENVDAPVAAHDSYGDVRLDGVTQDVTAGTKTGDVSAKLASGWHGKSLVLWTTVGNVTVVAPAGLHAKVDAHTRLGDVTGTHDIPGGSGDPTFSLAATIGDVAIETH